MPKVPGLNTASLPDMVFILLFFFLLLTNMQGNGPMVDVNEPQATEYTILDKKHLQSIIYVGVPFPEYRQERGTNVQVQVDDQWMEIHEIVPYFTRKKALLTIEQQEILSVLIRADQHATMNMIGDVEQALREAKVLKVNYGVVTTSLSPAWH